jgi:Tfp pilus assembly protein FimT
MLRLALCGAIALTTEAFSVSVNSSSSAPTCLDSLGKKIDWWFIYKQPNGFGKFCSITTLPRVDRASDVDRTLTYAR